MTTDNVKQPPDNDREVLVRMSRNVNEVDGDFMLVARYHGEPHGWSIPGIGLRTANIVDWRELPSWDRLAILDRYDEERKEWERLDADLGEAYAVIDNLKEKLAASIEKCDRMARDVDALRSQVTALTEERSRVLAMLDGRDCAIDEACEERDAALARADRAEKGRDEATDAVLSREQEFADLQSELSIAISERDDLKEEIGRLRGFYDVADLRTRMEAIEEAHKNLVFSTSLAFKDVMIPLEEMARKLREDEGQKGGE